MIFIDTGALLAKYLVRDQHHKKAIELWNLVRVRKIPCIRKINFSTERTFSAVYLFFLPHFQIAATQCLQKNEFHEQPLLPFI